MPTILVIDDDAKFAEQMDALLSAANYQVLHASDGIQAVQILEKRHAEIDLSIIDLGLPGINGFEIIGAISRRNTPVKIVAVTAVYTDHFLELCRSLGAHAAIRKPPLGRPLQEREWLTTVRTLIAEAERQKRTVAGSEPMNGADSGRGSGSNK